MNELDNKMAVAAFKVQCVLRSMWWEITGLESNLFVWRPEGTSLPSAQRLHGEEICNRLEAANDAFLLEWLF